MGTISKGILGGFSGKVGTVIGGTWKGIDYMRSIAASVSNPNTPAQLEQRAKFSAIVKFLKPLTSFLRIGFKSAVIKMSAFNAAMSYNYSNAITGTYPVFDIDYTKVLVSQGNFPGALNPLGVAGIAGAVEFIWEDNTWESDATAEDLSVLIVYNPTKDAAISVIGATTRAIGSQTITLPNSYTGDEVQCYIAFTNANKSVISNSQFVGSIIVT